MAIIAFAEPYERSDVQTLAAMMASSLESTSVASDSLQEIVQRYEKLDRTKTRADELLEMKYMLSHWKSVMAMRTVARLESRPDLLPRVLRDLEILKPRLEAEQVSRLVRAVTPETKAQTALAIADYARPDVSREAVAKLGDAAAVRRAGPAPIAKIKPYDGTNLRGLDWINGKKPHEGVDQYELIDEHTVRFRGQTLKSGDILVADLALPHDGVLSSFMTERSNFSHAALFVVLKVDGRNIPAVLEMHEKGNRVVPLANFLGNHTYYAEAYRVPNPPPNWGDRLSEEVVNMMVGEKITYDFQARDIPPDGVMPENQKCATCTSLLDIIYRRTGMQVPGKKSEMVEGSHRNLDYLGMTMVRSLLTPTDVMRSGMVHAGVFDNGQLRENLARELILGHSSVPGTMGHLFATGDLDLKLISWRDSLFRNLEVSIGQADNVVGAAGRAAFNFQEDEVPKTAPEKTVAFYLISNDKAGPISKELAGCAALNARVAGAKVLSLRNVQESVDVGSVVSNLLKRAGIPGWYRPRRGL